jgi:hypothetical protein
MLKRLALADTFLCLAAGVALGIRSLFEPQIVPMRVTYPLVRANIILPPVRAPTPPAADKDQPKFSLAPPTPGEHASSFHRSYTPSSSLGAPGKALTARAGSGSDAFGAGNGSGDTIGGQCGGSGVGGARQGTDTGLGEALAKDLRAALLRDQDTEFGVYNLVVRAWLDPSGHVNRAEIETSSG